jgi:serine phosphatase RsbU (regulator of sigma subunit)
MSVHPGGKRWPLAVKLLLVTEALLLAAIAAMLLPVRDQMRRQVIEDMQSELRGIAATAALQLDGDALARVRSKDSAMSPEFLSLRTTLTRIRDTNNLQPEHIYTLFRDDAGQVRFGVMTHPVPFVADPLAYHDYMSPAFDLGHVATSGLYTDKYGQWISAFAPVRDSRGEVVGVLEVDRPADAYFARYRQVQWITAAIALAALGVGSLLGLMIVDRVVLKPMRAVRGGMQALSRQDFSHRVSLRTRDEFEDLGHLLNDLSRQLNAARQVAQGFLPRSLPSAAGWRFAALAESCEATAGDYYDVFTLPSGATAVLVADVTGHGLGPSLHMSACRSALRALASIGLPPDQLLARLDRLLQADLDNGNFITLLYGVLEPDGHFTFCNAGHAPALLLRRGHSPGILSLDSHRPPLGIPWEPIAGEEQQTRLLLHPGDRLLLCSDGVPEARSPAGIELGNSAIETPMSNPSLSPESLVAQIKSTVESHCQGKNRADDVTILCVERTG